MRFLLGAIFGVLLLVVVVFIADSLATSESETGAAPRQIVNWDVPADRLDDFMEPYASGGTNSRADYGGWARTDVISRRR
jgi:hypothetical protein